MRPSRELIVVSAVALVEGGPLTILKQALAATRDHADCQFLFIIHSRSLFDRKLPDNVKLLTIPWARRNYLFRCFVEYCLFPKISKRLAPRIWFSLHDTSAPVTANLRAVYCHNPIPFFHPRLKHFLLDPKESLRAYFYRLVYFLFCKTTDYFIVQTSWFRPLIQQITSAKLEKILICQPDSTQSTASAPIKQDKPEQSDCPVSAIYPALPRVFKNIEFAVKACIAAGVPIEITISGQENRYSKHIASLAKGHPNVSLKGRLSHEEVLLRMKDRILIFPSHLETFGLPITEAMSVGSPVILPVTPWTLEIASRYGRAYFYETLADCVELLKRVKLGQEDQAMLKSSEVLQKMGLPSSRIHVDRMEGFSQLYTFLRTTCKNQVSLRKQYQDRRL